MEALTLLRERRSVRKFKNEKVDLSLLKEIIETTSLAPSWANFQPIRFTIVEDSYLKDRIGDECYNGFKGNISTLKNAPAVAIVSYVNAQSGHAPTGEIISSKADTWSMFDAGIASQQFCLAAYEKGIGTVIQGIFDEDRIANIIDLPEGEIVAAVIPFGFEEKHTVAPKRKAVEELVRFI